MSRKKTVEEHIANGTYRPSVHGPRPDARPTAGQTSPVGSLGKPGEPQLDAAALAVWRELMGLLNGRIKPEDGPQLEQAAVWLSKWRQIISKLDLADPGTVTFARLVAAASTASKAFDRIARKFGLSPLDRESLSVQPGTGGPKRW